MDMGNMTAVSMWSGGKDSCFAFYKARNSGYDIKYLLNFTSLENPGMSISHGLSAELIRNQAEAIGTPIMQRAASNKSYETVFKKTFSAMKKERINKFIFGDIYLREHRDWIERVCKDMEVEPIFPIWRTDTDRLIEEFIGAGFESIIVSTNKDLLGEEWLGRKIDRSFTADISRMGTIDPCGEKGEFHTFVYNGPIFKKPLEFALGQKVLRDKRWFLRLNPAGL